jgi:hypothetical protein
MEKAITIVKKAQFIKNIKLPSCIDCQYYIGKNLGKCSKFGEKDLITGKIVYGSVTQTRFNENLCSTKGNYFEAK